MTSEYDKLRSISQKGKEDENLKVVAEWLLDICIEQADKAKKGWNFDAWKKFELSQLHDEGYDKKAAFIDDCHDVLAHQHIDAFTYETYKLISELYNALIEVREEVYDDGLSKTFPEFLKMLQILGYKPYDKSGWMWVKVGIKS